LGGSFSTSAAACAECAAGSCLATGSASATSNQCQEGYYCASFSGGTAQAPCAAGFYCPTGTAPTTFPGGTTLGTALQCALGTITGGGATFTAAASCLSCAAGSCLAAGSISQTAKP
jgi:hypothetical protein